MTASEVSTVVSSDVRRATIVNLKQVSEIPLRNALESFDKNGDGKIDISELQKIVYWYGLWKYASFGLCLVIMLLVWSTFGLTIWAINLTKEYSVTDGVLTEGDEVVKMSVASTLIPLSWATLLDRRHLDSLESLTIDVTRSSGKFSAGVYHVKVASYLHANSTYLKVFGTDGSRVWVNSGTVVLHHPDANEAIMVCGAAACNTLAVDVKPEYLKQLVQRSTVLFESNKDFELPASVDGVAVNQAAGDDVTCMADMWYTGFVNNADEVALLTLQDFNAVREQARRARDRKRGNAYGTEEAENDFPDMHRFSGISYDEFQGATAEAGNTALLNAQMRYKNVLTEDDKDSAMIAYKQAMSKANQMQVDDMQKENFERNRVEIVRKMADAGPEIVLGYGGSPDWSIGVKMVQNTKSKLHNSGGRMEEMYDFAKEAARTRVDVEKDGEIF